MKNKIIIAAIAALVVLGGVAYVVTRPDKTSTTAKDTQTQSVRPPTVSLEDALTKIGATGNTGPVNGNTYTYNGIEYQFDVPSSWGASMNQRKQACEQGYINTSYQVVTDGSTWFASANNNSDYTVLAEALKSTGIDAKIASYC